MAAQSQPFSPRITLKPESGTRQASSTLPSPSEEADDEFVELSDSSYPGQQFQIPRGDKPPSNRMTKSGAPDRRYKGQRDLPDEQVMNPQYTRPTVGGTDESGTHVTKDGKLDRRFLENRNASPEEAEIKQAESILSKYGRRVTAKH